MASPTTQSLEASVEAQISSPASISLQILGVHTVDEHIEVDFDLWIDYSKQSKIKCGKFIPSDKSQGHSWIQEENPGSEFLATSCGWIKEWLSDGDIRKKYFF